MLAIVRRRWKTLLGVLSFGIILFNAVVYLDIPAVVGVGKHQSADRVRDYSHIQVLRKRLNKSFNNSSSIHNTDNDIHQGLGQDGVNDHEEEDDRFRDVDDQFADKFNQERLMPNLLDLHQRRHETSRHRSELLGSRANYSLEDVDDFVIQFKNRYKKSPYLLGDLNTSYHDVINAINKLKHKGARLRAYINNKGVKSWERFHYGIRQHNMYDPNDIYINKLLRDMATKEIIDIEQKEGGTQIKLIVTFEDEGQALFKPMRFQRDQETLPDHFYFADYERHHAEIAAFHLDRILGFHRVPPTIGRFLNVSSDIHRLSNSKLAKTFFWSPAKNFCFHGHCSYYCDSSHPICGHPWLVEGSLAAFLPPNTIAKRKTWRNPWKRSYSKHRKAYWEVYNDLCEKVKEKHPYSEGRRLLDVLDMSVFDFLTGNLDRHHYETFREFGNTTFLMHLDNGRAFGKAKYDCISCLAPVRQCCMIRQSTLTKLVKLYQGPQSLSQVMRDSLTSDPVHPILLEPHLDALDRRLSKILHVINGCLQDGRDWSEVIIDDGVT